MNQSECLNGVKNDDVREDISKRYESSKEIIDQSELVDEKTELLVSINESLKSKLTGDSEEKLTLLTNIIEIERELISRENQ